MSIDVAHIPLAEFFVKIEKITGLTQSINFSSNVCFTTVSKCMRCYIILIMYTFIYKVNILNSKYYPIPKTAGKDMGKVCVFRRHKLTLLLSVCMLDIVNPQLRAKRVFGCS